MLVAPPDCEFDVTEVSARRRVRDGDTCGVAVDTERVAYFRRAWD